MFKPKTYTLQELADASGVEPRTIRSWIEKDLLPGALGRGSEAKYEQLHLDRIRAVQVFREAHRLTLEEIRQVMLRLTDEVIHGIAAGRIEPHLLDLGTPGPDTEGASAWSGSEDALGYVRALRRGSPPGVTARSRGTRPTSLAHDRGAHSPSSGAGRRLEHLADTLARLARRPPKPKVRSEWWASVAVTPDLELRARGLDSGDIPHLEQVADLLRALIQEGSHR